MRYSIFAFLLLLTCLANPVSAQLPSTSEPNYSLRNKDFIERRRNDEKLNFAKEYWQATAQLKKQYAYKNGQDEWIPVGPFGNEDLAGMGRVNSMTFHPTDTNTWYICVAQGGLWKTTNRGESWTSISGDLPILRTSSLAIDPSNPDIMYVAMGDFAYLGHNIYANENKRNSHYGIGIYKTINGGQNWSPTGLSFKETDFEGSLIAKILIHPLNPLQLIAVGQTGCYLSANAGQDWNRVDSSLFWDLEQDPVNPNVLIASTGYVHSYGYGEAGILRSSDFGATWTASITPIPKTAAVQRIELAYAPSDPNLIYGIACDTVGGFYGFYKSTDAGANFTEVINQQYPYNLLSGNFNNLPGGQGRYDLAICVDREDKDHVIIGGINIWHTRDGGQTFAPVSYWRLNYYGLSVHADVHEIRQHPGNSSFFACHDGGLSRSFALYDEHPDSLNLRIVNTEWVNYIKGLNITSFYRLSVNEVNSQEKMAGAQDNSTVYTNGTDFWNVSGGDGMESEFMDEQDYRYTSSQNGAIYCYVNSGGAMFYLGNLRIPNVEKGEWTTPFVAANGRLYALYENLYSFEGDFHIGTHSQFNSSWDFPQTGTALDVQKSNGNRIYMALRGYASQNIQNHVLTSSDGGNNWMPISNGLPRLSYPSYLEMSQLNPNQVWACFSGFDSANKVFYSSNAGQSWTNITYNLPNIPVNCIVHQEDGSGLVYIGTDHGVYYLRKDSTAWVYYSETLPKVIVSELEIDTAKRTLVAATFGRGLWETALLEYDSTFVNGIRASAEIGLEAYPNPTQDRIELKGYFEQASTLSLKVIDITGRVVQEKSLLLSDGKFKHELNVHELPSGDYFILLSDGTRRKTCRFTKL